MTNKARGEMRRHQPVSVAQPEIEWTPADRIAPGEYPAYSRSAKTYFDPMFRRWVCAIQFDVLDDALTNTLARVSCFLNLGAGEKPHAGRRSLYWREWVKANGGPPARGSRLPPKVFVKRHALVVVRDTAKDYRQQDVSEALTYSVIGYVVRWETGGGKESE
jgi:hypothetical protein